MARCQELPALKPSTKEQFHVATQRVLLELVPCLGRNMVAPAEWCVMSSEGWLETV